MFNRSKITEENIQTALKTVLHPRTGENVVDSNMVQGMTIKGNKVTVEIVMFAPSTATETKLNEDIKAAVSAVDGVGSVNVNFSLNIPGDGRMRDLLKTPVGHVIAVASGKGGVGKSTVAVNLAVALAQAGARVGLLDADIYGPNVPTMMGVLQLPPPADNKMTPAFSHGVKIMSIGFLVKPEQPLIWRGPMLHTAIRQFASDVQWGELDYMIIDLPPGTGDAPLSVSQSLPVSGGVIVTLPQQVSLDDARRGLEMFRQLDIPIFGVVENMSYLELPNGDKVDVFGAGGGKKLAEASGVDYIGGIPMDPAVRLGGDTGMPVLMSAPQSPVSQALRTISEEVAWRVTQAALAQQDQAIPINIVG